TFNRPELFLPAILVGSLGNGLGTYLGFLVARLTQ
ncbi:MAG: putative membrane protein, partial [Candidatus Azotimanducaceae bacterium]